MKKKKQKLSPYYTLGICLVALGVVFSAFLNKLGIQPFGLAF